jgi:hypothetical protein
MKIKFVKDHQDFKVGNICEMYDSYAINLIKSGHSVLYTGESVEIMPVIEPQKEMVYVPIIVNEEQLFGGEDDFAEEVIEEKKFKSKLK